MKLPLLICTLLFIIAGSAYGQLGQSEDATAGKFGKPFRQPKNEGGFKVINYRTDTYDITAGFWRLCSPPAPLGSARTPNGPMRT